MRTKIEVGNISDVGKVRTVNEDYFGSYSIKDSNLIVVCDGMGGHKGGATASRTAVDAISKYFEQLSGKYEAVTELRNALLTADEEIKRKAAGDAELKDMGSTAVILLIKDDQVYTAHIGDSRIYMIREGQIYRLTKDHSLVQQMIDAKMITEEAAKEHPKKNVITRCLGEEGSSEPETAEPFAVFKNDIFILCSDGLTGYVEDNELLEIASGNSPQDACRKLIDMANGRGGKDNITIQIAKAIKGKGKPWKNPLSDKTNQLLLAVTFTALAAVFTLHFLDINPLRSSKPATEQITPADSLNEAGEKKDSLSSAKAIKDSLLKAKVIAPKKPKKDTVTTQGKPAELKVDISIGGTKQSKGKK